MNHEKILFVDDDPNLLEASRRVLRGTFVIVTALGGEEGLERLRSDGPFAVVVSDLRMPTIDGISLLREVRDRSPETVRILLTGNADTRAAIDAVNQGRIFRFLTKPCPGSLMRDTLQDAVRQYRLETSERVLTQQTLRGSIRALVEMLSLAHPDVAARTSRVRRLTVELCEKLKAPNAWQIEVASLLSHVGFVGLPAAVVEQAFQGNALPPDLAARAAAAPELAAKLIASIPRMEEVQSILLLHGTHWNGTHSPIPGIREEQIPLGARVLRAAMDFDTLLTRGAAADDALLALERGVGIYDPAVVRALAELRGSRELVPDSIAVRIADLQLGMVIAENLRNAKGMLVVAKGQEVTEQLLLHVRHYWDDASLDAIAYVQCTSADGESRAA